MRARSDEELYGLTQQFRRRLDRGETLDDLLPEAFAAVREVARRNLGQRHYDVQLIGGIVLHRGQIAEMKTGEGQDPGRHSAGVPECPHRPGRPRGNGQRLPGPPRPGLDGPHLPQPGPNRGLPPARYGFHVRPVGGKRPQRDEVPASGLSPGSLPRRRAVWHQQRVRVRLLARQHVPGSGKPRPAGAALRHRGRGGQHSH